MVALSYIQKEMCRLHTETTRSSDYLLKTVLLLYMLRPDAARVAGYVTTSSTVTHMRDSDEAAVTGAKIRIGGETIPEKQAVRYVP